MGECLNHFKMEKSKVRISGSSKDFFIKVQPMRWRCANNRSKHFINYGVHRI